MKLSDDEVRALLRALDATGDIATWTPEDFDYRIEADRFASLVARFQGRYANQCLYETGSQIQDAFFHSSIYLSAETAHSQAAVWIRFSNFGGMATYGLESFGTFRSDREIAERIDPGERAFIESALADHGYTIVPSDPLRETYDGTLLGITPAIWMFRFFHYQ